MEEKIDIAVARGDGIGPEIMQATLDIVQAVHAPLRFHEVEIGEKVYLQGFEAGIHPKSWDTITSTKAFLKAPITTPQGGGYRSLNVSIRTALGLYANVRPCIAYAPFVQTKHPKMNVVIIRENEEDLYVGLEYRPAHDYYHAAKIITQGGCERIIRYAFEYAKKNHRKKVTCFTKDNILKLTDGLFHKIFESIAKEYPTIEHEHWIVDIGAAKLAATPEAFDVIVLPNLYGDILSDVAAQIAGSVGLAGSANIGTHGSMFEAIHGSAPKRANQNIANPSGLILASVMMLEHLGLSTHAACIQNAWLKTIEDGIHTYDIYKEGVSHQKVGTKEFALAVIDALGKKPSTLQCVKTALVQKIEPQPSSRPPEPKKTAVGVDFFVVWTKEPEELKAVIEKLTIGSHLTFSFMASRGLVLFPASIQKKQEHSQLLRLRFMQKTSSLSSHDIVTLHKRLLEANIDVTGHEQLYTYDDIAGFSASSDNG
jgi:isocitrate dehydrogenase